MNLSTYLVAETGESAKASRLVHARVPKEPLIKPEDSGTVKVDLLFPGWETTLVLQKGAAKNETESLVG